MKSTTCAAAMAAALAATVSSAPAGAALSAAPATAGASARGAAPTAPAEAETAPLLHLRMGGESAAAGDALSWLPNTGLAPVSAVVVASDGGRAVRVSRDGGSWGARLPAFAADENPPRAVIRVDGAGATNPFNPQVRDFRFGAAFNLDALSQGSAADDGNNLVQRGLHGDGAQFKLQIDDRVPTCSVTGDEGAVVAQAPRVDAGQWYRVRCIREGNEVTIRVVELTTDGGLEVDATTARGAIGSVAFAADVPLSVGGKLGATGDLIRSSGDQFNGVVDNVYYDSAG